MIELTKLERDVVTLQLRIYGLSSEVIGSVVRDLVVTSREFTGAGFFADFRKISIPGIDRNIRHLGDVEAEIPPLCYGAGFILFFETGDILSLEGFTYEEKWPDSIDTYSLSAWKNKVK